MLLKIHQFGRWLLLHRMRLLAKLVDRFIYFAFSAVIPSDTEIGDGTLIAHGGLGTVFHPKAKIGKRVLVAHNVTLGGKSVRSGGGAPTIGNDVYIGAGACVLGNVTIGDDCLIGANAVVVESFPDGTLIVGIPAKAKETGIRARDIEDW